MKVKDARRTATTIIVRSSNGSRISLSMGSMLYRTMILEEGADIEIMVMALLTFLLFFVCTAIVRKGFKKR